MPVFLHHLAQSGAARQLRVDGRLAPVAPLRVDDVLLLLALVPGVEAGDAGDVALLRQVLHRLLPLRAASFLAGTSADPYQSLLLLLSLASEGVELPDPEGEHDSRDDEPATSSTLEQMQATRWDLLIDEYAASRGVSVEDVLGMPWARFLYFFSRLDVYVARRTLRYSRLHILHAASEPQTLLDELRAEAQYAEAQYGAANGSDHTQTAEEDTAYEIEKGRRLAAFMTAHTAEARAEQAKQYWKMVYAKRGIGKRGIGKRGLIDTKEDGGV